MGFLNAKGLNTVDELGPRSSLGRLASSSGMGTAELALCKAALDRPTASLKDGASLGTHMALSALCEGNDTNAEAGCPLTRDVFFP